MRLKDIACATKDLFMLSPDIIQEEVGWNVRIPGAELDAHIRQLADSIKEIGVVEPVTVYLKNDVPVLTNGHCRLMAVRLAISEGAEIKSIPARAEERYANDADRVLGMITRNGGKALTALEQAEVIKRLLAYGWKEAEIARKTGFSGTHVTNLLRLSAAPAEVVELVKAGKVSARVAGDVLRRDGERAPGVLKAAVESAKEQGRSKATAKHVVKSGVVFDWKHWGPRLKGALEAVRDADSPKRG